MWGPPKLDLQRGPYNLSVDDFIQGIALGRICTTTDVANAVIFLASEESSLLTAADIPLDGRARAKYWPWTAGKYTGVTTAQHVAKFKRNRYGVAMPDAPATT
jgi:hypothetical protein